MKNISQQCDVHGLLYLQFHTISGTCVRMEIKNKSKYVWWMVDFNWSHYAAEFLPAAWWHCATPSHFTILVCQFWARTFSSPAHFKWSLSFEWMCGAQWGENTKRSSKWKVSVLYSLAENLFLKNRKTGFVVNVCWIQTRLHLAGTRK